MAGFKKRDEGSLVFLLCADFVGVFAVHFGGFCFLVLRRTALRSVSVCTHLRSTFHDRALIPYRYPRSVLESPAMFKIARVGNTEVLLRSHDGGRKWFSSPADVLAHRRREEGELSELRERLKAALPFPANSQRTKSYASDESGRGD